MKYTKSIKDDRVFRQLYKKGSSCAFPTVVVYYRRNRRSVNQLGLTTTKKIGKAVIDHTVTDDEIREALKEIIYVEDFE